MSRPDNSWLPGFLWDGPACNACNNTNPNVKRCDEDARYKIRAPNAEGVSGFLVAVFRVAQSDGITNVDTVIMSDAQFIASGLQPIHALFRIKRRTPDTTVSSSAGMIIIPEIVEQMNGRMHRGYTRAVKMPTSYYRVAGGSACQTAAQWKDNQNCRSGWHAKPRRGDGGWDQHCGSCCGPFNWEWSCFQHRPEGTQKWDWSYTPYKRDMKGETTRLTMQNLRL